jgi:hypothetical protein
MHSSRITNVFSEIGEAIGNIGKRVDRRSHSEFVDELFRKRLARATVQLPEEPGRFSEPEGEVIDVEYRVLDDSDEEANHGDDR